MTGYEVVDFRGLRALGVPYSRSHIDRLEERKRDPFPKSFKLGEGRGARRVWWLREIIEWLKRQASSRQALA
jgi:predicted DNA-binding transcriptional regulator AlpA